MNMEHLLAATNKVVELNNQLTAVTEQRDRLAEALKKAKALYTPSSKGEYQTGWHDAICWVGQQALQSLNQNVKHIRHYQRERKGETQEGGES